VTLEKAFWGITPQFVNHAAITKKPVFSRVASKDALVQCMFVIVY